MLESDSPRTVMHGCVTGVSTMRPECLGKSDLPDEMEASAALWVICVNSGKECLVI